MCKEMHLWQGARWEKSPFLVGTSSLASDVAEIMLATVKSWAMAGSDMPHVNSPLGQ